MLLQKILFWLRNNGESFGVPLVGVGLLFILAFGITGIIGEPRLDALGVAFALVSVGLAFIAIGFAGQSDKKYTAILERIESKIPYVNQLDKISQPKTVSAGVTDVVGKVTVTLKSEEAAQQRLDEDTKRVGFVRGEIYQLEDGSWGIHWGGKYPL